MRGRSCTLSPRAGLAELLLRQRPPRGARLVSRARSVVRSEAEGLGLPRGVLTSCVTVAGDRPWGVPPPVCRAVLASLSKFISESVSLPSLETGEGTPTQPGCAVPVSCLASISLMGQV